MFLFKYNVSHVKRRKKNIIMGGGYIYYQYHLKYPLPLENIFFHPRRVGGLNVVFYLNRLSASHMIYLYIVKNPYYRVSWLLWCVEDDEYTR